MARRKHVKRIDPRYFLHETANRKERRFLQEEDEPLAAALDRMRADEPLPSEYDLEGSEFRPNWYPAHAHPDDADPWQRRQDSALFDLAIQAKYGAPDPRGLEDMPYYPEDPDERAEAEAALSARLGSLRDPPPKKKKDPWAARTEETLAQLRGEEDTEDRLANLREVYGVPSPTKDERYTDAGRIADIVGDKGLARAKFRLRHRDDPEFEGESRKSVRGAAGGVGAEFLGGRDVPGAHEDTAEEIAQLMMTSAPNYARDIDLDDPKYNQPQESIQHLKALVLQELEQMRLQEGDLINIKTGLPTTADELADQEIVDMLRQHAKRLRDAAPEPDWDKFEKGIHRKIAASKAEKAAEKATFAAAKRKGANQGVKAGTKLALKRGGAAALGPGAAVLGAGLTGYEGAQLALGPSGLDVLPTSADGDVYGVTDLGLALGGVGSTEADTSGLQINPEKGYNKYLDPDGTGVDKFGRTRNESKQRLKALVLQELEQMRLQEQGQLRELVSKVVERLQEKLSHG